MAGLLAAEQVARAADLEVLGREPEARAELGQVLDRLDAPRASSLDIWPDAGSSRYA